MKPEQLQFGWGCENESVFAQQLVTSLAKDWEVYIKPPFGKPETVLEYLAGYVNRIAISNSRIEDIADDKVTFRYRDYRDEGQEKLLTLSVSRVYAAVFSCMYCRQALCVSVTMGSGTPTVVRNWRTVGNRWSKRNSVSTPPS